MATALLLILFVLGIFLVTMAIKKEPPKMAFTGWVVGVGAIIGAIVLSWILGSASSVPGEDWRIYQLSENVVYETLASAAQEKGYYALLKTPDGTVIARKLMAEPPKFFTKNGDSFEAYNKLGAP